MLLAGIQVKLGLDPRQKYSGVTILVKAYHKRLLMPPSLLRKPDHFPTAFLRRVVLAGITRMRSVSRNFQGVSELFERQERRHARTVVTTFAIVREENCDRSHPICRQPDRTSPIAAVRHWRPPPKF